VRPLFHPAAADVTVEGILHALSDPLRVQIFADIAQANCPQTCSTFLKMSDRDIPKSTLSQHFKVLREAGLVRSERKGVEMHNTPRCQELEERFPGLVSSILRAHIVQRQENSPVRKPRRKALT
jgi:DNA-binding transcriptional ArsR family regulator